MGFYLLKSSKKNRKKVQKHKSTKSESNLMYWHQSIKHRPVRFSDADLKPHGSVKNSDFFMPQPMLP